MKVTVSFNGTKIVVPCGKGQISVRELTQLAATRYKKATGRPNGWITVSSLKSEEGGMLDPDDLIRDVCDDREQLKAIFTEQGTVGLLSDSEVAAMTRFTPVFTDKENYRVMGGDPGESEPEVFDSLQDCTSSDQRTSLHVLRRKEPLGASANEKGSSNGETSKQSSSANLPGSAATSAVTIVIPNEIGPLGIHVVPCNEDGRLVVQGIEPGGRIDRDGRLAVLDEIVDINGYSLLTVTFAKAQEIFKEALFAKELVLQVIKAPSGLTLGTDGPDNNKENLDCNSRAVGAQEAPPQAGQCQDNTTHVFMSHVISFFLFIQAPR